MTCVKIGDCSYSVSREERENWSSLREIRARNVCASHLRDPVCSCRKKSANNIPNTQKKTQEKQYSLQFLYRNSVHT